MTTPSPKPSSSRSAASAEFADVGLIVAAAGASTRFGQSRSKLLELLGDQPLIAHVLGRFVPLFPHGNLAIMVAPDQQEAMTACLAALGLPTDRLLVGGKTRQESVCHGLRALPDQVKLVAVQDGARPFSSVELLRRCIASARDHGTGVAARRVTDTIKIATADGQVMSTPNRELLWAAETPQVFQRELLQTAYRHVIAAGITVTDDAQAVELAGQPVYLVENHMANPKITFLDDLQRSETLLSRYT